MTIIPAILDKWIRSRLDPPFKEEILARIGEIERSLSQLTRVVAPTATPPSNSLTVRELVANRYLMGSGIEIGAFASPLKVPSSALVTYVDNCTASEALTSLTVCGLTHKDFGVEEAGLVVPDIVDDGQFLRSVGDSTQDFVIANHVLEHYEDPLSGFKNILRVTKHGGTVYLALPDMRRCFDRVRVPTPIEHVLRDYEEGPKWSRAQAFREFGEVFVTEGMDKGLFPKLNGHEREQFIEEVISELEAAGFSIHFHAWTPDSMIEMFLTAKRHLKLNFEFEIVQQNGDEVLFVFRKSQ